MEDAQKQWQCARCGILNTNHVRCGSCWAKKPAAKRPRAGDENVQPSATAAVTPSPCLTPAPDPPPPHRAGAPIPGPTFYHHGGGIAQQPSCGVPAFAPPTAGSSFGGGAQGAAVAILSAEQRCVVEADASAALLVIAAPGSGKTRVLARRIAHLVAVGVRPTEICALTFSRRAARELRSRVLSLGSVGTEVLTFHSLCVRLVRKHALLLGLRIDFGLAAADAMEQGAEGERGGESSGLLAALRDCASKPNVARRLLKQVLEAKNARRTRPGRRAG
ncbi:P-loop containing nucleoside triphosphate hydrolase protein [Pavlovales sp. CCMP2436]|nr:P-loop containing nucleoside triphosphate hydrolase protein [Pavlovales sp. CCMP2436]